MIIIHKYVLKSQVCKLKSQVCECKSQVHRQKDKYAHKNTSITHVTIHKYV